MAEIPGGVVVADGADVDLRAARVLTFHPDGPGTPVVIVTTWSGEGPGLGRLVASIGPERPVHAVTPPTFDDPYDYPRRVSEWMDHVESALSAAGVDADPIFGGWSFGGVVAAHMAQRRWERAGSAARRPRVVMVDSRSPATFRRESKIRPLPHKILHHLSATFDQDPGERLAYLRTGLTRVEERRAKQGRSSPDAAHGTDQGPSRDTASPLRRAILVSWFRYEPVPIDVDGTLLWCDDSCEKLGEISLGWGPWWRGPFATRRCGPDHFGVYERGVVEVIGAVYRDIGRAVDFEPYSDGAASAAPAT